MDFPIQINTIRMGLSIIYSRGLQVNKSSNYVLQDLKIVFIRANSAGPDEMPQNAAFHLGLHFLPKYPFSGFQHAKGKLAIIFPFSLTSSLWLSQRYCSSTHNRYLLYNHTVCDMG